MDIPARLVTSGAKRMNWEMILTVKTTLSRIKGLMQAQIGWVCGIGGNGLDQTTGFHLKCPLRQRLPLSAVFCPRLKSHRLLA